MSNQEEIKQLLIDRENFTERMQSTSSYNLADSSMIRLQSIEERIALLAPDLLKENERLRRKIGEVKQDVKENYIKRSELFKLLSELHVEKSNERVFALNRVAKESAEDQIELLQQIHSLCQVPPEFDIKKLGTFGDWDAN